MHFFIHPVHIPIAFVAKMEMFCAVQLGNHQAQMIIEYMEQIIKRMVHDLFDFLNIHEKSEMCVNSSDEY